MNAAQKRAIASLERAFARADKAGLAFCGMDGTLYAYPADALDAAAAHTPSLYEAQQEVIAAGLDRTVNTHGTYRESGGW